MLYVKKGSRIYEVDVPTYKGDYNDDTAICLELELVCGYCFINDRWDSANAFVEEVQDDYFNWLPMFESLTQCLEVNGYEVCELPGIIWEYKEDENEMEPCDEDLNNTPLFY